MNDAARSFLKARCAPDALRYWHPSQCSLLFGGGRGDHQVGRADGFEALLEGEELGVRELLAEALAPLGAARSVVDAGQPTGGWVPGYRVGFVAPAGSWSARLTVLDCKTTPGTQQPVFDDFCFAATSLRLHGQRFKVDVTWKTSNGQTGPGTSNALSADTGYFGFFSPENVRGKPFLAIQDTSAFATCP